MTAMDILEALGQTGEELLCSCDVLVSEAEHVEAGPSAADGEENGNISDEDRTVESQPVKTDMPMPGRRRLSSPGRPKYRRAAVGIAAAAAVLLLVYVVGGGYIGRSFDTGNTGRSESFSTQDSTEITADTAEPETAEEESAVEESETVETEEGAGEDREITATTEASGTTEDSENAPEEESGESTLTESAALPALQLAQVYLPAFETAAETAALSEEEYEEMMDLVEMVQEEINAALSTESMETLPVYRFAMTDASDAVYVNLIEHLGDYPVITQQEAEELLWQGYYLSPAGFSAENTDSAEAVSVELCYLVSPGTLIYMPYYQFTVVIEEDMVYVCCVPAVSREYLTGTLSEGVAE